MAILNKTKRVSWAVFQYVYFQDDEPGSSATIFIMLRVKTTRYSELDSRWGQEFLLYPFQTRTGAHLVSYPVSDEGEAAGVWR
jgi:hypothetical protein